MVLSQNIVKFTLAVENILFFINCFDIQKAKYCNFQILSSLSDKNQHILFYNIFVLYLIREEEYL